MPRPTPDPSPGPGGDLPRSLGRPALRALAHAGYTHLAQLEAVRDEDLGRLHGVGPKALRLLREALASRTT